MTSSWAQDPGRIGQLGTESDAALAARWGISRAAVRKQRVKLGIPVYSPPEDDLLSTLVQFQATPDDVADWQRAAAAGGEKLSVWLRRVARQAAQPTAPPENYPVGKHVGNM